jgi:hypothetical protein
MFAPRGDAPADGGDMLADAEVEALHKGRINLPAGRGQYLLDSGQRAKHDLVPYADQPVPPHGLHHLRREQPRPRQPPGLRWGAFRLAAWWLDPLALVRQQRGRILLEAIGEEQRQAAWCQHLDDLMHQALRHGQRAVADLHGQ